MLFACNIKSWERGPGYEARVQWIQFHKIATLQYQNTHTHTQVNQEVLSTMFKYCYIYLFLAELGCKHFLLQKFKFITGCEA